MILISKILVILLLIALGTAQALEGQWRLRSEQIQELAKVPKPIFFEFKKIISSDNKISGEMTIKACKALIYTYDTVDDYIYFKFKNSGISFRACELNEIRYLRGKIDSIFYFYILKDLMLFLPGNGFFPVKFDRTGDTPKRPINGIWRITDGVLFRQVKDPLVIMNGVEISMCGGDTRFLSKIISDNLIQITQLTSNGCNGLIEKRLDSAALFRVNPTDSKPVLKFYDKNIGLIAEFTFEKFYGFRKRIDFSGVLIGTKKEADPFDTIVDTFDAFDAFADDNDFQDGANSPPSQTPVKTNNQPQTSSQTSNSQQAASKPTTNVPSSNININQGKNTNSNPPSTLNNNQRPAPLRPSTPNTTPRTPAITPPKISANIQPSSFTLASSAREINGIWYPYNTDSIPTLRKAGPNAFQRYQLIINPARLMIRGGCNTIFTSYSFSQGIFSNFKKIATKKACPVNNDDILEGILLSNNKYFVSGGGKPKFLEVRSAQGQVLLQLIDVAPK